MDVANELLDAIEIIVDKKVRENTAQIYPGICKSVSGGSCVMSINGKDNTIQFYGSIPTVGAIYRVFVPSGNMSMAFAITGNDDRKGLHYSNPNLLDNCYFGNLVDQRGGYVVPPGTTYHYQDSDTVAGTTSAYYTVIFVDTNGNATFEINGTKYWCVGKGIRGYTGTGYGIDRWKLLSGGSGMCWTLIENDGITIGTDTKFGVYFLQIVEPSVVKAIAGKTVTLSVLAGEKSGNFTGNILINGSWNDYWAIEANDVSTKKYTVPANATSMVIQYAEAGSGAGTCKLKAAKLELGSQQTLAHQDADGNWSLNEIPDYGEQLARCQRYFQLYSSADLRPAKAVDCRPTMRTDPSQGTIVIDGTTYYYNTADLQGVYMGLLKEL